MPLSPRRALLWSFAERYAGFVITVASTLVLARLLTPAEVGVYSVCAALAAVAGILRDFGVSEYLIQERELTHDKIRAAFSIALGVAWTLGAVVFLSRHAVADFFGEARVADVLAVMSLHFLILPLSSPAFALLNREMAFRKIFALQITCNLVHALTSVTLAWHGWGPLSLAWGPIAGVATQTLILTWLRPHESLVWPGWRQGAVVLRFGTAYMASRLIETLAQNFHETVIAKKFDFASVGLFSRALGLVQMFHSNVADAVVRVATPAFAAEHRLGRPVAGAFARATAIFVSLSWPFFVFVALCAAPIIHVMFGPQWQAAGPLASILALAALPAGLVQLVPQLLSATGHVQRRLRLSLWVAPVQIVGVLLTAPFGLRAVAAVSVLSSSLTLILSVLQLRAALKTSLALLFRPCVQSTLVALASAAAQAVTLWACQGVGLAALSTLVAVLLAGASAWWLVAGAVCHPAHAEVIALWRWLRARLGAPAGGFGP